jgi:hypothetical protein
MRDRRVQADALFNSYPLGATGQSIDFITKRLQKMTDTKTDAIELLAVGTRVVHFDGEPSTHGVGTITGYNKIEEQTYALEKAVDILKDIPALGQMLTSTFYSKAQFPYIVMWDHGYQDVYEPQSLNVYKGDTVDYLLLKERHRLRDLTHRGQFGMQHWIAPRLATLCGCSLPINRADSDPSKQSECCLKSSRVFVRPGGLSTAVETAPA